MSELVCISLILIILLYISIHVPSHLIRLVRPDFTAHDDVLP